MIGVKNWSATLGRQHGEMYCGMMQTSLAGLKRQHEGIMERMLR